MEEMINMKKILVLAIMALGISTNVFACSGNSMIEDIMADKIIRSKELEDITKKENTNILMKTFQIQRKIVIKKKIKKRMKINQQKMLKRLFRRKKS